MFLLSITSTTPRTTEKLVGLKPHRHRAEFPFERIKHKPECFKSCDAYQSGVALLAEDNSGVRDLVKILESSVSHLSLDGVSVGEKEPLRRIWLNPEFLKNLRRN